MVRFADPSWADVVRFSLSQGERVCGWLPPLY